MTVSNGDNVRITAHLQTGVGNTINNVWTFHLSGGGPVSDSDTMADLAVELEGFYSLINDLIVDNVAYIDITGFNLTTEQPLPVTSWPTLTSGADVGDPLPDGVAGLIIFRTGFNRSIGRKFIGGMSEGSVTGGLLTAGVVSDLAAAGATMTGTRVGATSGATWAPCTLLNGTGFATYIEAVASNVPAYQRRRRPGTGI